MARDHVGRTLFHLPSTPRAGAPPHLPLRHAGRRVPLGRAGNVFISRGSGSGCVQPMSTVAARVERSSCERAQLKSRLHLMRSDRPA